MKKVCALAMLACLLSNACLIERKYTRKTSRYVEKITYWDYGYIDKTGRVVIEPLFSEEGVNPFSEGLAAVSIDGLMGYIEKTGKIVIQPRFNKAFPFSEGVAVVEMADQRDLYFIDNRGEIVINLSELKGYEFLFVDSDGNKETHRILRIDRAWPFSEGLARVKALLEMYKYGTKEKVIMRKEDSKGKVSLRMNEMYGFIDKAGKIRWPPVFGDARDFSEGMAAVERRPVWIYIGKDARYGFSKEGYSTIYGGGIGSVFEYAYDFSNGAAEVIGYSANKTSNKFINLRGEIIWTSSEKERRDFAGWLSGFDEGQGFRDGLAAVKVGNKFGYINTEGEMVIEPQYMAAKNFSEGLASVRIDGLWGYIDKSGRMAIGPQFSEVFKFSEGYAGVKVDNAWGFIDKNGKVVIQLPPEMEIASRKPHWDRIPLPYEGGFKDGLAIVRVPRELEPEIGAKRAPTSAIIK